MSTRTPSRRPQAVVIGDGDASSAACADAEAIAAGLASRGIAIVTGGRGGIMSAANKGAREAGGLSIGILPGTDATDANRWCDVAIPTGLGHARNAVTALAGDVVIVIGGAAGTLSEMAFGWLHQKPIVVLTCHGGWADRIGPDGVDDRTGHLVRCDDRAQVIDAVCAACRSAGFSLDGDA